MAPGLYAWDLENIGVTWFDTSRALTWSAFLLLVDFSDLLHPLLSLYQLNLFFDHCVYVYNAFWILYVYNVF